jgi:hypothetical protein
MCISWYYNIFIKNARYVYKKKCPSYVQVILRIFIYFLKYPTHCKFSPYPITINLSHLDSRPVCKFDCTTYSTVSNNPLS